MLDMTCRPDMFLKNTHSAKRTTNCLDNSTKDGVRIIVKLPLGAAKIEYAHC